MIDIHCHILPELDDGAASLQEAVMMAAMAADDGIRTIVATPHISWNDTPTGRSIRNIDHGVNELREALRDAGIPVEVIAGAEVLCIDTKTVPPTTENFPCLGGTHYALVEFFFNESAKTMDDHLHMLQTGGITPIIAHPERYSAVQKDGTLSEQWVRSGCLLQVNKGSLQGQFGRPAEKTAKKLLKEHLVSFLATDAHNTNGRTTRMKEICRSLAEVYGEEYIHSLVKQNPMALFECAAK